ncbi:MAG: RIP metalloprotease RseP [Bacteroidota bacterium]
MSSSKSNYTSLGVIAVAIIGALGIGYATGNQGLVLDILLTIGLLMLGITVLVTIHELGHFLTAKAFGMRVEIFSIGFPPKIFSIKKGETDYQFGATPLGGYVKISGMIDESLDTDHISKEPEPYEFRAKPVWQRLIVMVGGVVMNILLGIFIFSMIKFSYGEQKLPLSQTAYGIEVFPNTIGEKLGFQTGDKLVSYRGEQYSYFDDFADMSHLQDDDAFYRVERNGETKKIEVPSYAINFLTNDSIYNLLFEPDMPAQLLVSKDGPALSSGLQTGDLVTHLDSQQISLFSDLRRYLSEKEPISEVLVTFERDGVTKQTSVILDSLSRMVVSKDMKNFFILEKKSFSFFESFGPGTAAAFGFLSANVQGFKKMADPNVESSKMLLGPLQIAKVFFTRFKNAGWPGFLELTGMLSMILAFMNILPIPALDGGHVVFLLYEGITRREPSTKVRLIAQQVGMVIVLGIMVLVLFNDAIQVFFN